MLDLSDLLTPKGAAIAAAIFGLTFFFRYTLAQLRAGILAETWVKIVSMAVPLVLGVLAGVFGFVQAPTWQERVIGGLVAATFVMVGRDVFKLGGKLIARPE